MFGFFAAKSPSFLTDGGIFSRLRELVVGSKNEILLVAPYIDPNDDLVRLLVAALKRGVTVEFWLRKDKAGEYRGKRWFNELSAAGATFRSIERLHAKLYVIDETCIMTSMNLTEGSWNDSREVGFVLPAGNDELVGQLRAYMDSLEEASEPIGSPRRERTTSTFRRAVSRSGAGTAKPAGGHCIRCSDPIPLNPKRPYCKDDYEAWAEYGNDEYRDKYCHSCGEPAAATMKRPLCRDCFTVS